MKVAIRADASLQIGTGHVMRCLTLAEALKNQGAEVYFICREHHGNLIDQIQRLGFKVHKLSCLDRLAYVGTDENSPQLFHANWLGVSQQQDAEQCKPVLELISPDWMIVDHYAIDYHWHNTLKSNYKKLMVIDDLADRRHECDLLLDQTFAREQKDYQMLVPEGCQFLLGSQFALLRSEFAQWREFSLQRRNKSELKKLLITMGGVDSENVTWQVLDALAGSELPMDLTITVIMGVTAPNLDSVKQIAENMPCKTEVKVDVTNMAELMANADIAIGAVGATTWERCALGLPTIIMIMADNQVYASTKLDKVNIGWLLRSPVEINKILSNLRIESGTILSEITKAAISITDGKGVDRVCEFII